MGITGRLVKSSMFGKSWHCTISHEWTFFSEFHRKCVGADRRISLLLQSIMWHDRWHFHVNWAGHMHTIDWTKSTWEQECATPGFFFCYESCHSSMSSSSSLPTSICSKKEKNFYPQALSSTLNTVHWRTRGRKELVRPEVPVKKIELLEWASMHVFSGECITIWKESGCASLMTHLKFCRDRPQSMELHTLVLIYSWPNSF